VAFCRVLMPCCGLDPLPCRDPENPACRNPRCHRPWPLPGPPLAPLPEPWPLAGPFCRALALPLAPLPCPGPLLGPSGVPWPLAGPFCHALAGPSLGPSAMP
jgi:hypothetical protein